MRQATYQLLERWASHAAASSRLLAAESPVSSQEAVKGFQHALKRWANNTGDGVSRSKGGYGNKRPSMPLGQISNGGPAMQMSFRLNSGLLGREAHSQSRQFWKQERRSFNGWHQSRWKQISQSHTHSTVRTFHVTGRNEAAPLIPLAAVYGFLKIWMTKPAGVLLRTVTLKNVVSLARAGKMIR